MPPRTTRTNPAPRTTRVSRLEARITREALAIVRRAAQIQGRSVSDFVVAAALEAAQKTVTEIEVIRLSRESAGAIQMTSRTHITLPEEIRADLDRLVEKRSRSRFITDAVRQALLIARQKEALQQAAGAWKDKDHPETQGWVRRMGS